MKLILLVLLFATTLSAPESGAQAATAPRPRIARDTFETWMRRVSNTGRWGPADELGALNHITPAIRAQAAATVKDGISVSLAHDVIPGPNPRSIAPVSMRMMITRSDTGITWALDSTTVLFHGWAYSHLDALSHAGWRGSLYNGISTTQLQPEGAQQLGIHNMHAGIVGRAVLFDIPRLLGVPYLEPTTIITAEHLARWETMAGVRVQPGDIVLIRTGRWAREAALGTWSVQRGAAGPHPHIALWLHERSAAALGGDVANESYPTLVPGVSEPLHQLALVSMGMPLMDNLDFEELARVAGERRRWSFFFVAAPARIRGGTGSLINPLVVL